MAPSSLLLCKLLHKRGQCQQLSEAGYSKDGKGSTHKQRHFLKLLALCPPWRYLHSWTGSACVGCGQAEVGPGSEPQLCGSVAGELSQPVTRGQSQEGHGGLQEAMGIAVPASLSVSGPRGKKAWEVSPRSERERGRESGPAPTLTATQRPEPCVGLEPEVSGSQIQGPALNPCCALAKPVPHSSNLDPP